MKRMIAGFAVALALSAGPAVADGMDKRAGAGCCASSWSGFYIGAGAGGMAVAYDIDTGGGFGTGDYGSDGVFGTVTIGLDHQINSRVVVGLFADYDFTNIKTSANLGLATISGEFKNAWSVGGRLGVLSSPTTLWYGTAGYTQASVDVNLGISVPDFNGYFVGGGVESQLGRGWSLKGEYRYSQYGSETVSGVDVEPSTHSARAVLSYKFGRRDDAAAPLK
jgi:outer membrane immunogenic protein